MIPGVGPGQAAEATLAKPTSWAKVASLAAAAAAAAAAACYKPSTSMKPAALRPQHPAGSNARAPSRGPFIPAAHATAQPGSTVSQVGRRTGVGGSWVTAAASSRRSAVPLLADRATHKAVVPRVVP